VIRNLNIGMMITWLCNLREHGKEVLLQTLNGCFGGNICDVHRCEHILWQSYLDTIGELLAEGELQDPRSRPLMATSHAVCGSGQVSINDARETPSMKFLVSLVLTVGVLMVVVLLWVLVLSLAVVLALAFVLALVFASVLALILVLALVLAPALVLLFAMALVMALVLLLALVLVWALAWF
jgi:hypothetical protein